jgi:hypothetical protein
LIIGRFTPRPSCATPSRDRSQLYAGSFRLEQQSGGGSYSMLLDGKISDDQADRGKSYAAKASLPRRPVDISLQAGRVPDRAMIEIIEPSGLPCVNQCAARLPALWKLA